MGISSNMSSGICNLKVLTRYPLIEAIKATCNDEHDTGCLDRPWNL